MLVGGHVGDVGGRAGEADDGRTGGDGRAREPGSGAERGAEHGEWWLLTVSLSLKLSLSRRPVVAQATVRAWLPATAFRRILVWPRHVVTIHVCGQTSTMEISSVALQSQVLSTTSMALRIRKCTAGMQEADISRKGQLQTRQARTTGEAACRWSAAP